MSRRALMLLAVAAMSGCSLIFDTGSLSEGSEGRLEPSGGSSGLMGSSGATSTAGSSSSGATSTAGAGSSGGSSAGSTPNGGAAGTSPSVEGGAPGNDGGAGAGPTCASPSWYPDVDGDGYGDDSGSPSCEMPGYVETGGDCDDQEAFAHPGLPEYCDGIDNDCDEQTTEECPLDCEWALEGHMYLHCWIPTSQPDASAICADNGMRLARVDDATEQTTLWEWHTPDDAWLGGSDADEEGAWKWEDGEVFWDDPTAVLYEDWATGEPSNSGGIEHCLLLNGPSNWWNDHDCDDPFGFICERY